MTDGLLVQLTREVEVLKERLDQAEADRGFASSKCEEGLHCVLPVIRETKMLPSGEVIAVNLHYVTTCCDRLFELGFDECGALCLLEIRVDPAKLAKTREQI